MYIAGIHRVSSSVLYLYALYIGGFPRIGIGVAKYRRDGTNGWHWAYTIRVNLDAARKEVSHAA
jgi:hypothetical protein